MYDYSLEDVRDLKMHCHEAALSVPDGFFDSPDEALQACYNGIGPEQWSSRFRRFTTWLLTFLEASALIHDWEFTFQPKTYGAFTVANLRLAYNAAVDGHPFSGFAAGILCQLFGWKAYKEPRTINKIQKESHMKTVFLAAAAASFLTLTGCFSPTRSIITEYDESGRILRRTETSESVVRTVVESTKDKSILVWDNSFLAYLAVTTSTVEDPTPTMRMGVGRADKGAATIHKDHDLALLPEIITSARTGEIGVTGSGVGAKSAVRSE